MKHREIITDDTHSRYKKIGTLVKSAIIPKTTPPLAIHTIQFDDDTKEQFLAYQFDTYKCPHHGSILYGKAINIDKQHRVVHVYCEDCQGLGSQYEYRIKNDGPEWYLKKEIWHEMKDYKGNVNGL